MIRPIAVLDTNILILLLDNSDNPEVANWKAYVELTIENLMKQKARFVVPAPVRGTWGRRWTLEEVKEYLGHSSIQVTQRYAHLDQRRLHEAAAATTGSAPRLAPRGSRPVGAVPSVRRLNPGPATVGWSGPHTDEELPALTPSVVRSWCAEAEDAARAVITLAAGGSAVPGVLLQGLAAAVLQAPEVQLARQVAEGGPFVLDRALELAELVLGEEAGGAVSTVDTAEPRAQVARRTRTS